MAAQYKFVFSEEFLLAAYLRYRRQVAWRKFLYCAWSVFTKARRFEDGLLLFQGPQLYYWLPNSAAVGESTLAEAERLVGIHVPDSRDA